MKPEAIALVENFLNREGYTIPLSLVSETVQASHKDVTNWRQRGLLFFPIEKIGNRYMVTRNGAIALGVMAETAWLVGPELAAGIAKAIFGNFFSGTRQRFDVHSFRDTVIYFRKPLGPTGEPRFPGENENTWDAVMGFPLQTATAEMIARQPVPNGTTVTLPIGQLLCRWALRFETVLGED